MTRKEISDAWSGLVLSAPLNTPRCPKCEASTYNDCNAHTDMIIKEKEGGKNLHQKNFLRSKAMNEPREGLYLSKEEFIKMFGIEAFARAEVYIQMERQSDEDKRD